MAGLRTDIIDRFERLTKYRLADYFDRYLQFVEQDYPKIVAYYTGRADEANMDAFFELQQLRQETERVVMLFVDKKEALRESAEHWEIMEKVDDILLTLETVDNTAKWARSSITKNNFNPKPEVQFTMRQRQTLERVWSDELGNPNRDDEWIKIAFRNDLREEDYNTMGGAVVSVSYGGQTSSIIVRSVVDNMIGEKVYGLDVQKRMEFEDSDLKVLTYKETIKQAAEILSELRREGNPEFGDHGLQRELFVGVDMAGVQYPAIIRQMTATFGTDDTFKSFQVTAIRQEQDAVFIDFSVETRLSEIIDKTIKLA